MSGNEKYIIRPDAKRAVESNKPVLPFSLLEGRRMILNAKRRTVAFTVFVWTTFGAYAYYTYTHKTPKEITPDTIKETTVYSENEKTTDQEQQQIGLFSPILEDDSLKVTPENFFQICPSKNPHVVLNAKLDRFEVTETYYKYAKEVQHIPIKSVLKDDYGDYVYDERGYPVVQHHHLIQPVYDAMDKIRSFLTF